MAAPRPKGNTRTGQDREFTSTDNAIQTQEMLDRDRKREDAADYATVAPDAAGMEVIDRAQRMGKTMTTEQLTEKLKAINPNFVVQVSKGSDKTKCIIRLPLWEMTSTGGWVSRLTDICGCENTSHPLTGGVMPEFSVVDTIDEIVPGPNGERKVRKFRAETRGWRTVVAMLLMKRYITIHDVEKHFGLTPSKDSARWHEIAATPLELMAYQGEA